MELKIADKEKIIDQIVESSSDVNIKSSNIDENDKLEDLGVTSLDKIYLLMQIEIEFDIFISDNDADDIKTVKDIYELLLRK